LDIQGSVKLRIVTGSELLRERRDKGRIQADRSSETSNAGERAVFIRCSATSPLKRG
jgi:hypothetical protein